MKKGRNSAEKLLEKVLELDTVEFLGVCKILGIELVKVLDVGKMENVVVDEEGGPAHGEVTAKVEPRSFEDIWNDMCDKLEGMNRTQRRNLGKLVYAATKKSKDDKEEK